MPREFLETKGFSKVVGFAQMAKLQDEIHAGDIRKQSENKQVSNFVLLLERPILLSSCIFYLVDTLVHCLYVHACLSKPDLCKLDSL